MRSGLKFGSKQLADSQGAEGKAGSRQSFPRSRVTFAAASFTLIGLAAGRFATTPTSGAMEQQSTRTSESIVAVSPDSVSGLEAAVQRNPNDLRSLQQLAVAYTRRAAIGDPSYYGLADQALNKAEHLAPGDDTTAVARGALDLSLHQFARALELGARVHRHNPYLNDADAVLVDASVELGNYADARRYLQELVDRRASLPSYARVSYLRELHGDLDGAATAMQLAITAGQPGSADVAAVRSLLGDIEFSRGDLAGAEQSYRAALRSAPTLPLATLGLARVNAAQGRVVEAIKSLHELTQRYPLPAAVAFTGDLEQFTGDSNAASASYALVDAIETVQRHAGQVVDLEMAQFDLDHHRVANGVRLAESAYKARPNNVFVDDVLAWARYRQGRYSDAATIDAQALRLGSADAGLHFHAAAIAKANGDLAGAKRMLTETVSHNRFFSFAVRQELVQLAKDLGISVHF